MDYKGYNIAVHELGHNVEQTFSLNEIDHTLLYGVPNNAVHRGPGVRVPGVTTWSSRAWRRRTRRAKRLKTLNDFWGTYEISGVALVDMDVWHWMYDHPKATPARAQGRRRCRSARDIWNQYYAPVFSKKDVVLLGDLLAHDLVLRSTCRITRSGT